MKQKGLKTKRKIEMYFQKNPYALQEDAAKNLGLCRATVCKYAQIIREENNNKLNKGA